jgi:hypothetical protein
MDCENVQDLIEAHVLGALDGAEASAVRLHLRSCPDCRRLARSYEPLVAAFPEALAAASPLRAHPSVKDRVIANLDAPGRRRLIGLRRWPLVAAVATLLLALSVGWGYQANRELTHERAVNAELQGKLQSKDQLTVFEVVDSPSTKKLSLRSTNGSSAYGKIFTKADTADVVVMVNRLPQPVPGETYQLWLTSGGTTRMAGRLAVDADGFAYLIYHDPRKGPTYQAAVVTLQAPGRTSPGPMALLRYQAPSQLPTG